MKCRLHMLVVISILTPLCSLTARAEFDGYPWSTNYTWYAVNQYYPMSQIYSGIVERCESVGISSPEFVQQLVIEDGSENQVTNVLIGTNTIAYTNLIDKTSTLTVTNTFYPVAYSYTDITGATVNAFAHPYPTPALIDTFDAKIRALIPYFVSPDFDRENIYTEFGAIRTTIPALTEEVVWENTGVGFVYTNETHKYIARDDTWETNYVTSAEFTRQPETVQGWALAESHYTGAWKYVYIGETDWGYSSTLTTIPETPAPTTVTNTPPYYPVVYWPTYTSSVSPTVTITGTDIGNASTNEALALTGIYTECVIPWGDVTALAAASWTGNTSEWYAVTYTNRIVTYGDMPYRMYGIDIDERAAVLDSLRMTRSDYSHIPSSNVSYQGIDQFNDYTNYAAAVAGSVADFAAVTNAGSDLWRYSTGEYDLQFGAGPWYFSEIFTRQLVRSVAVAATNIPHKVRLYDVFVDDYGYDDYVFDDFGEGWTGDVWQATWLQSSWSTDTNEVTDPIGSASLPTAYASEPAATEGTKTFRGYRSESTDAVIEWQYEY